MLVSLTSTSSPARNLGFLLRKYPDRVQTFTVSAGAGHVLYSEATDERCTAALLLDVDPIGLVRGKPASADGGLEDAYVNDRPYAASSFTSVAIARIFGQALGGRSDRPELAARLLALTTVVVPIRIIEPDLPQRLFGALGYTVDVAPVSVPEAARAGAYARLSLSAVTTLRDLLTHLYVLIPVLDDRKHYWVDEAEVEKLFRHGGEWLAAHPERELITRRYLRRAPALARAAVAQQRALDDADAAPDASSSERPSEAQLERPMRLQERRIEAAVEIVRRLGAKSVLDLGCGDGDFIAALAREPGVERILGMDVSARELERAKERLTHVPMAISRRERIELVQSSLLYVDERLTGFDVAALLEVIEHVEPDRLPTLERVVFEALRPRAAIVTTPNREYNARFPALAAGGFRHTDHRFEWTRAEFARWAKTIADRFGYALELGTIGDEDAALGSPTQLAIFRCN